MEKTATKLRSDLLVTPASALAEDYPGSHTVTRELLHGVDHMQLLRDEEVYGRLGRWMGVESDIAEQKKREEPQLLE